ncbi:N-glycosylase, partial [Candidatus Micrarchaeota archaeon]|nr:N-glycosylase [Candidatus Micrarchaeota archaeon]
MRKLESEIKALMKSETGVKAKERIKEFLDFDSKTEEEWFSELCFCILTANTSAEMGLRVQKKVSAKKFLLLPEKNLALELKKAGSRFYNRRANFICSARKFYGLKELMNSMPKKEKRNFLVKNIKG